MTFNKDRFRKAYKAKKLTLQDLVDELHHKFGIEITLAGIKNYIRKNKDISPSTKVLSALADILGVSTDYLLGKDLPLQNSQININNVDNKNGNFAINGNLTINTKDYNVDNTEIEELLELLKKVPNSWIRNIIKKIKMSLQALEEIDNNFK